MSPFTREIDQLEEDAKPYARKAMVRARRFAAAFMPAFLATLISSITSGTPLTVPLIWSIALSVTVTVLGEIDPSIPWSTLAQLLDRARYRSDEPLTVTKTPPSQPPRSGT